MGVSPNQRRMLALVEVLLCSSLPTQLSIGKLMQIAGFSFEPTPTLSVVVILSLGDTAVLLALMVALTRAHGESVRALWLGPRHPGREAVLGLLLVPPVFLIVGVLMTVLMRLAPALHNIPTNPLEQ